jgi:hypothetical protein
MPRRPSAFVNLQDYLALNREAGGAMGQRVAGSVQGQVNEADAALKKAQGTFGQKASEGANPFTAAGATAESAKKAAGQTYKGPSSLEDVDPNLGSKVRDAVQRTSALKTPAGAFGELKKTYGAGQYAGGGMGALDTFLMQDSPEGSAALSGVTGGDLGEKYVGALEASQKQGLDARKAAGVNAGKWKELAKKLRGEEIRREKAALDEQERLDRAGAYTRMADYTGPAGLPWSQMTPEQRSRATAERVKAMLEQHGKDRRRSRLEEGWRNELANGGA